MKSSYFEIFINSDYSEEKILSEINLFFLGYSVNNQISSDQYDMSIIKNDRYDLSKAKVFPDGFLNFKFLLEIDYDNEYVDLLIHNTNLLISALWSKGIAAVVSSDFEEELLNKGGYNHRSVPFPYD